MVRTIYKYPIPISNNITLELPYIHNIIHIDLQGEEPTIWVMLDPSSKILNFTYAIIGTGHPIPDSYTYIKTFQQPPFVWHLFAVQ